MATHEEGLRGNGRGAEHDREEMMRESDEMRWHAGRDIREDLDRRTNREEIDRRHDWHRRSSEMEGRESRRGAWGGGPSERFPRGESGDVWSGGRMEPGPSRSYGGGAPSSWGTQYGADEYGTGGGYGGSSSESGWGGYGAGRGYGTWEEHRGGAWGEQTRRSQPWREESPPNWRGGYGGYGGGHYSGSYGGMGGGEADAYRPAGSHGGVSGAGSMAGTFGEVSGWEPERQHVRPGAFAMHSMMVEGGREQRAGRRTRRGWEPEGALVRDVMTREPRSVQPDSPAREAARMMREEDAGVMPVMENGRVIGIVTDRDLAMRIVAEGRDTNTQVRDVMSTDVHVCTPDDKLVDAVRIMGEENVRRLPVVDRDDRLKGMLSMSDIAREAEMDYALQEALERIAARRSFWSRW